MPEISRQQPESKTPVVRNPGAPGGQPVHPLPPDDVHPAGLSRAELLKTLPTIHPISPVTPPPDWPILVPLPPAHSLAQYQTPIRNQLSRDTCWAFAAVAALEALYVRKAGAPKDLDLSEQFFAMIGRYCGVNTAGENAAPDFLDTTSTLWGGGGNSGSAAFLRDYCIPLESAAPYLDKPAQLAVLAALGLPEAMDDTVDPGSQAEYDRFQYDERIIPSKAFGQCYYGAGTMHPLPDTTVVSIKRAIAANHEVIADINNGSRVDSTGRWNYAGPIGGSHTLLVVGYDDNDLDGTFLVKNSYGGTALTRISYDFFTHSDVYFGGAYIDDPRPLGDGPRLANMWLGRHFQNNDGRDGLISIHRVAKEGSPQRLGDFYDHSGYQHFVNGYLSDDEGTMYYWIADGTGPIDNGAKSGQALTAWVFGTEPDLGAGISVWNGQDYGVQLDRRDIAFDPASTFVPSNWVGTWDMDHDGHHGRLSVTAIGTEVNLLGAVHLRTMTASYVSSDGTLKVTGNLVDDQGHHAQLSIDFPGGAQTFDLFFHTWATNLFSGWTVWNNAKFGVMGRRHVNLVAGPPLREPIHR